MHASPNSSCTIIDHSSVLNLNVSCASKNALTLILHVHQIAEICSWHQNVEWNFSFDYITLILPCNLPWYLEIIGVPGGPLGNDLTAHRRDDTITKKHTILLIFLFGASLSGLSIIYCTINWLACDWSMHTSCFKKRLWALFDNVHLYHLLYKWADKFEVTTCNEQAYQVHAHQ